MASPMWCLILVPRIRWHGDGVYWEEEYPSLLFAKEGEVFDLDGKQAIVMGGAYSIDKMVQNRKYGPIIMTGWFLISYMTKLLPILVIPNKGYTRGF